MGKDLIGIVVGWNYSAEQLYGYTTEERLDDLSLFCSRWIHLLE